MRPIATIARVLRVLGIDVDDKTIARWTSWFAPAAQPFFVDNAAAWPTLEVGPMTPEIRDTYALWRVADGVEPIWLDEAGFGGLTRKDRAHLVRAQVAHRRGAVPTVRAWSDVVDPATLRSQADGHRFVWWPSLMAGRAERILDRMITTGLLATRHRDVRATTWKACETRVPGARQIAGTFAPGSGPNCFGTVLAAAGVPDATDKWVVREPFDAWLSATCRRGGRDDLPATILVWRTRDGLAAHAAITIGDGWALEKPSQEWWTPRIVASLADVLRTNRTVGLRLERHHIAA